ARAGRSAEAVRNKRVEPATYLEIVVIRSRACVCAECADVSYAHNPIQRCLCFLQNRYAARLALSEPLLNSGGARGFFNIELDFDDPGLLVASEAVARGRARVIASEGRVTAD